MGTYPLDLFEFWPAVYRSRLKLLHHIIFYFGAKFRYYVVGARSYFLLGKGHLSLILYPSPRGLEWFLFVTKNDFPGVS